jgi:beta-lactamase class A
MRPEAFLKFVASVATVLALLFTAKPTRPQEAASCSQKSLENKLQVLGQHVPGQVGISALLIESRDSVSLRGSDHFPMQSVYKLPIVMTVLQRVAAGKLDLRQRIRVDKEFYSPVHSPIRDKYPNGGIELTLQELLAAAIVDSDGVASDILLSLVSPGEVTEYAKGLGVKDMMIATSEKEMSQGEMVQYRNWTTPLAAVALLEALQRGKGLPAEYRDLVLKWMTESVPGSKRLKGLLPAVTLVAHKTGTSGTVEGMTRATNDVGIVTLPDGRHIAIAAFVSDSAAPEVIREGVIAQSARLVWDCWSGVN